MFYNTNGIRNIDVKRQSFASVLKIKHSIVQYTGGKNNIQWRTANYFALATDNLNTGTLV